MWLAGGIALSAFALSWLSPSVASAAPRVYAVGDGERVNPESEASRIGSKRIDLSALRGETVSLQIAIDADDASLDAVTVEAPPLRAPEAPSLAMERFVEHFVSVRARSRNDSERGSSLGFTAAARPSDEGIVGALPDALIPIGVARCGVTERSFCPYPLRIASRSTGAIWIDVSVPESQAAALYSSRITVRSGDVVLDHIDVSLRTSELRLPYRAVSFFAFYAYDTLEQQFDEPRAVERQLWQLLHAHHVDALAALTSTAEADRLAQAYSGAWFTPGAGYRGPGEGAKPEVAAIGAYGSLGAPSKDQVDLALAIGARLPASVTDRFVYTVDEECKSPLGRAWRDALRERKTALVAGRTCGDDPRTQEADLVMMPAQAFQIDAAREARKSGRRVFVYNGQLPFAGPMMLDVPVTSLTADAIASASIDVGRWFLWETTFWGDGNRGGHGPRDVFDDPETFHNADGDTALADGLLVYPGRQRRFPQHSLDAEQVLPSMRLKALRRGIEDAGLFALAERIDPAATLRIAREAVDSAFDDVSESDEPGFVVAPAHLASLRAELRAIVEREPTGLSDVDARAQITHLREARATTRRKRVLPRSLEPLFELTASAALFMVGYLAARALRRPENRRREKS